MNLTTMQRADIETSTLASQRLREQPSQNVPPVWGLARIARMAYEGKNLEPLFGSLQNRLRYNPQDTNALLDSAFVLFVRGYVELALRAQKTAAQTQKAFTVRFGDGSDIKLLALVRVGDLMANTPIEFLLEGTNVELTYYFIDEETTDLNQIPDHDAAFLAVGQSRENELTLKNVERLIKVWHKPLINGNPERIRNLTREGVSASLASQSTVITPPCCIFSKADLAAQIFGGPVAGVNSSGLKYPLIARPVGTHAGKGMQKIECSQDMSLYLAQNDAPSFYVSPYVDYRSPDGYFRKQRIVFIKGQPFPCHQATSKNWMVHYLNADMEQFEDRRRDEADWFENFPIFVRQHKKAFEKLFEIIGLDYFGIDCAESKDGRLLVFEVDVAMIVHSLDSETVFPYKKPAMKRLQDGFLGLLRDSRAFSK